MVTWLPWQPQGHLNISVTLSHIKIIFGMLVPYDNGNYLFISLPGYHGDHKGILILLLPLVVLELYLVRLLPLRMKTWL